MAKYIMRLDDACPQMDRKSWEYIESVLDKYSIKPIVGVIPNNKDPKISFSDYTEKEFWTEVIPRWYSKGWTLAQHGYEHVIHKISEGATAGKFTEFFGLPYKKQKEMIDLGYHMLLEKTNNQIKFDCFFAPCHTFDNETINAIRDTDYFLYISDGYALFPYNYLGVNFLPNICDNPRNFVIPGYFTLIMHPGFNTKDETEKFEGFFEKHNKSFVDANNVMSNRKINKDRNLLDKVLEKIIYYI